MKVTGDCVGWVVEEREGKGEMKCAEETVSLSGGVEN